MLQYACSVQETDGKQQGCPHDLSVTLLPVTPLRPWVRLGVFSLFYSSFACFKCVIWGLRGCVCDFLDFSRSQGYLRGGALRWAGPGRAAPRRRRPPPPAGSRKLRRAAQSTAALPIRSRGSSPIVTSGIGYQAVACPPVRPPPRRLPSGAAPRRRNGRGRQSQPSRSRGVGGSRPAEVPLRARTEGRRGLRRPLPGAGGLPLAGGAAGEAAPSGAGRGGNGGAGRGRKLGWCRRVPFRHPATSDSSCSRGGITTPHPPLVLLFGTHSRYGGSAWVGQGLLIILHRLTAFY